MKPYSSYVKNNFNNNEIFDIETLKYIIEEELKENNISNYVDGILETKNLKQESFYDFETGILMFNYDNIARNLFSKYMNSGLDYTKDNFNRFSNISNLLILFHELSHINQIKNSKECNFTGDLKILLDEGVELRNRYPNNTTQRENLLYSAFHDHILTERKAEINAIFKVLRMNKELNILREDELKLLNSKLFRIILKNYNKQLCPAEAYYKLRGKLKEYKDIKFSDEHDNLTKIKWGMPIHNEELQYLYNLHKTSINNDNIENKILAYKKRN